MSVSAISAVLAVFSLKDLANLFRVRRVRYTIWAFTFLFSWTMLILAMIRHYSGLGWSGDWLEHFQRTLFFLHRFPVGTPILSDYQLAARPPMMNVLAAFFLAQVGDRFELFQVVFCFLNLLMILPCCLIMPALGISRRPRVLPLATLFAVNPVVIQNATYTWSKSLTAFFVITALWFYLAALRKNDSVRFCAAFGALAAGLLVHYSAGPYLLLLAVHLLWRVFRKFPWKWREFRAIALAAALLATWFGWSIKTYGTDRTFKSNTAVTAARQYSGYPLRKIELNIFDSIVPYQLRHRLVAEQPNRAGMIRDHVFAFYQMNLIFGIGSVAGPLAILLLVRFRRHSDQESKFWKIFVPLAVVVGIAVVGERAVFGSAHLTLIPLETLGITLVAGAFPWRRAMAIAVLCGCLLDFALGVFLQASVESLENNAGKTVFSAGMRPADGGFQPTRLSDQGLSMVAWSNWFEKHKFQFYLAFLDKFESYHDTRYPDTALIVARLRQQFRKELQSDELLWGGWWGRHNYQLEFLGDACAEAATALPLILCVAFLGLMALLLRELRRSMAPS